MGQAEDAQAAHLEQPGKRGWGTCDAMRDVHAVVGNQFEPMATEPQNQIGFPRSRRSDQQYSCATPGRAAPVDLHGHALWPYAARNERAH